MTDQELKDLVASLVVESKKTDIKLNKLLASHKKEDIIESFLP